MVEQLALALEQVAGDTLPSWQVVGPEIANPELQIG
jgi:hypothetical protein